MLDIQCIAGMRNKCVLLLFLQLNERGPLGLRSGMVPVADK